MLALTGRGDLDGRQSLRRFVVLTYVEVEQSLNVEYEPERVTYEKEHDDDQEHDGLPGLLGLLGGRRRAPGPVGHASTSANHLVDPDTSKKKSGIILRVATRSRLEPQVQVGEGRERDDAGEHEPGHVPVPERVHAVQHQL